VWSLSALWLSGASWFETARLIAPFATAALSFGLLGRAASPHHEGLGFCREKNPRPEEPRSGVSKDGCEETAQANLRRMRFSFMGRKQTMGVANQIRPQA
jgi:hypothetical protein